MDPKLLLKKISETCEWVYPSVTDNGTGAEKTVPWSGQPYVKDYELTAQLGPRITAIKKEKCINPCNWCGKIVNQETSHRMLFRGDNRIGWQHECRTCNRVYDPKTQKLSNPKLGRPKSSRS